MIARNTWIQSPLNFLLNKIFVVVIAKYFNSAACSKDLLVIFVSWFWKFCLHNVNSNPFAIHVPNITYIHCIVYHIYLTGTYKMLSEELQWPLLNILHATFFWHTNTFLKAMKYNPYPANACLPIIFYTRNTGRQPYNMMAAWID
jgi:hypothetical protein